MSDDASRVHDAYERTPYPSRASLRVGAGSPTVPSNWVNAVVWPSAALHETSRILVAGCGTGHEAARLATELPGAEVVAVDFSAESIAIAEDMKREGFPGRVQFEVADLTRDLSRFGAFDFVTCNAVADYAPDSVALLANLSRVLKPTGVLYLGVNSQHHPAGRLARGLGTLGVSADSFRDTGDQRAALRLAAAIMGDDAKIAGFAQGSAAWLQVEMFPAFAHHRPIDAWLSEAVDAGLNFRGSLNTPFALAGISDIDLPMLYGLDRGGVAQLVEGLRLNHMLPMLFTVSEPVEPPWADFDALQSWKPTTHPCVAPERIKPLSDDWMTQRFLAIQSPGLPELRLNLSAYMLELFRLADGTRSVAQLRAAIQPIAPDEHVRAALFRGYHASVLYMAP